MFSYETNEIKSGWRQHWTYVLWTALASISFAMTAWFARTTLSAAQVAEVRHIFDLSLSDTLGTLRALQEVTSVLSGFMLNQGFEVIEWTLVSEDGGIRALSFLTLSPTTSLLGVAAVAFGARGRISDRMWAIFRLMTIGSVWAAGFVLFFNTNADIVYLPDASYYITSGVGTFNSSLVQPYLTAVNNSVPYILHSWLNNIVVNTEISVQAPAVSCLDKSNCYSYLLPGTLGGSAPWPPGGSPQDPVVAIWNAPAVQYEFRNGIDSTDFFSQSDCETIGNEKYILAVEVCIAESNAYPGSLIVSLYVCSNGTNLSNQCLNEGPTLNISSTLSIYKRQASTINARSNWTILSVPEIGPPSQVTDTNISALRSAINWLLDYEAAGIPPGSAFMTVFWNDRLQLSQSDWSKDLILAFQSMFVVPMWFFSDINYGNVQIQSSPTNIYSGVPPEFTTTASLATPRSKIVINASMFYAYLGLELGVLLISWTVITIVLLRGRVGPVVSAYPLIDFAAKTSASNVPQGANGIDSQLKNLTSADNKKIRSQLSNTNMYLRVNDIDSNGSVISNKKSVVLVTASRSSSLDVLAQGMVCK